MVRRKTHQEYATFLIRSSPTFEHNSEQASGGSTLWAYNPDDTLQSITDARGASTTFTYNNGRHLPNVVTHTLAGASTIVESFSYDALGNRSSMSDSSGGTTYQYNQLSQLTSETRTFTGLAGSYTLSYDYHVGGQLKSITDHTNQRINYTYDNAGRVNALTGTNYTYGQFISSIMYRAWGQPRQTTYGNGRVESVAYNARLLASHYEVPAGGGFGAAVSIDYQYYDDGRLKFSHDVLDNRFDRSYEYDHAGRLTKALSGAEARGEPATNNRPYKETATYDAFDHLNVRFSKHWSKALGYSSSDTYSNNRRVGWNYDADGNWLSGAGRQYTYDAAGRASTTTWTGGYFNEFSDGDGRRVKSVEPNLVTYYLRSTVLGGEVVEELTSSGAKQESFIYYGHKVIGYDWANGNVSMVHEDPSGVTVRSSIPQSAYVTYFSELDPWGAEVFTFDPYLDDPGYTGGRGESGPVYPGFGDISMPSTGCTLDGVYIPCDMASRLLGSDAAVIAPGDTTRYNYSKQRFEFFRAFADGYSGFLPAGATYAGGGTAHQFSHYDYTSVTVDGRTSGAFHAVFEDIELQPDPQEPIEEFFHRVLVDKAFLSKLGHCLRDLFHSNPYEQGFVNKADGSGGSLTFKDLKTNNEFTITTDATTYTSKQLASLFSTNPAVNVEFYGMTSNYNPFINFIGSDHAAVKGNPNQRAYELYLAVQVHETGNSIALLLGDPLNRTAMKDRPLAKDKRLLAQDRDSGMALEECVFGAADTLLRHGLSNPF